MQPHHSFLPKLALRRPVTIWMGVTAVLVIGLLAYLKIPHQLYPSGFKLPYLYVYIPYPRATPKEVEDKIVRPGERMMASLQGLKRIRTWSRGNHGGFLLRFDGSTPMQLVYQQLRDRLERLRPSLPEEARRYFIWKWDPSSAPILYFGISLKQQSRDTYRILHQNIFAPLRQISGVTKLQIWGIDWSYINIEVDRKKARSHRINNYKLIRQLQKDNLVRSVGQLRSKSQVFFVRSFNRIKTLEDLKDYPLASGVKLRDLADVRFIASSSRYRLHIDGRSGIFVRVFKSSEGNTIEITRKIRKFLRKGIATNPALKSVRIHHFTDQGQAIERSLDQLQQSLLWGGVLAMVLLMLFLRNFRTTLLVMLSIPLSLLVTLGTLYFIGESLNLFSLMGLMLSVGMVVDNGIVVVENIARLRQQGQSARQAALHGTAEVSLAVLMATATTIIVFLPLVLMSGSREFRFHMSKVSLPVFIALVASLAVALLVIPLGAALILKQREPKTWTTFERITTWYRRFLQLLLRRRFDAVFLTIALFLTYQYPKGHLRRSDHDASRLSEFQLNFKFSKNYSLLQKLKYLKKVEKLVLDRKKHWGIRSFTTNVNKGGRWGNIHVYLDPTNPKKQITRAQLREKMIPLLPEAPGLERRVEWLSLDGAGGARISIFLYGSDSPTLATLAQKLEKHLKRDPTFSKVKAEIREESTPEIQLKLQRKWAFRYRMSARLVGGNVAQALRGRRLRNIRHSEHRYMVRLVYKQEDKEGLHQLGQLGIRSWRNPKLIPLETLVRSSFSYGPQTIHRLNRKTFLRINISTARKDLARLYLKLNQVMARFPMPEGYSWSKGFRWFRRQESEASQQFAMLLSLLFVFLLMGALFESFALPFSVLFSVPFAFLGVYWMLFWTNTTFDTMAGIGLVMLIGIVVNHAIVLVDRINQLRAEGLDRNRAILDAASQRFRPILMTTLTTIGGLLPMAWGGATIIGIPYAPLGRTVIGGLTASVILSLLVIPVFYTLIDDLRVAVRSRISRSPSS